MSARAPQAKKLSCHEKDQVGSYNRKSRSRVGGNMVVDVCMTSTPLLQSVLSLLAAVKGGPNSNQCARREDRIAKNFQIPYCDFEAAR